MTNPKWAIADIAGLNLRVDSSSESSKGIALPDPVSATL
jgi:hypothetical protein